MRADLVTVYHNDGYRNLTDQLYRAVRAHEPTGDFRFIRVNNRRHNRGFAKGCNVGAFHPDATAPVIGFLNPDLWVDGPFLDQVANTLSPEVVICGCRFAKPDRELRIWGVRDWVCGAAFFVSRKWFAEVGGFDPQFVWAWEETDLIRQAERQGLACKSIALPLRHHSPEINPPGDAAYKRHHFNKGAQRYFQKWGR